MIAGLKRPNPNPSFGTVVADLPVAWFRTNLIESSMD